MKRFLIYLFVIGLTGISGAGNAGPIGPGVLLAPLTPAERDSDTFHVSNLRQQEVTFSDTFWRYLYVKFLDVRIQLFIVPVMWRNWPQVPERKPVDSAYMYRILDKSDTIAALLKNLPTTLDGEEKVRPGRDSASLARLARLSGPEKLKYDSLMEQSRLRREKILASYPLTDELRKEYQQFLAILTRSQEGSPYILLFNDKTYTDLRKGLGDVITVNVQLTDVKDVAPPPPVPPPPPPHHNGRGN